MQPDHGSRSPTPGGIRHEVFSPMSVASPSNAVARKNASRSSSNDRPVTVGHFQMPSPHPSMCSRDQTMFNRLVKVLVAELETRSNGQRIPPFNSSLQSQCTVRDLIQWAVKWYDNPSNEWASIIKLQSTNGMPGYKAVRRHLFGHGPHNKRKPEQISNHDRLKDLMSSGNPRGFKLDKSGNFDRQNKENLVKLAHYLHADYSDFILGAPTGSVEPKGPMDFYSQLNSYSVVLEQMHSNLSAFLPPHVNNAFMLIRNWMSEEVSHQHDGQVAHGGGGGGGIGGFGQTGDPYNGQVPSINRPDFRQINPSFPVPEAMPSFGNDAQIQRTKLRGGQFVPPPNGAGGNNVQAPGVGGGNPHANALLQQIFQAHAQQAAAAAVIGGAHQQQQAHPMASAPPDVASLARMLAMVAQPPQQANTPPGSHSISSDRANSASSRVPSRSRSSESYRSDNSQQAPVAGGDVYAAAEQFNNASHAAHQQNYGMYGGGQTVGSLQATSSADAPLDHPRIMLPTEQDYMNTENSPSISAGSDSRLKPEPYVTPVSSSHEPFNFSHSSMTDDPNMAGSRAAQNHAPSLGQMHQSSSTSLNNGEYGAPYIRSSSSISIGYDRPPPMEEHNPMVALPNLTTMPSMAQINRSIRPESTGPSSGDTDSESSRSSTNSGNGRFNDRDHGGHPPPASTRSSTASRKLTRAKPQRFSPPTTTNADSYRQLPSNQFDRSRGEMMKNRSPRRNTYNAMSHSHPYQQQQQHGGNGGGGGGDNLLSPSEWITTQDSYSPHANRGGARDNRRRSTGDVPPLGAPRGASQPPRNRRGDRQGPRNLEAPNSNNGASIPMRNGAANAKNVINVHLQTHEGQKALCEAILCDNVAVAEWIFQRNLERNVRAPSELFVQAKHNLIFDAVSKDRPRMVDLLMRYVPEHKDHQAPNGQTPLSVAVEHGFLATANVLIQRGANLDKRSAKEVGGYSPLMIAIERGHDDLAHMLLATKNCQLMIKSKQGGLTVAHMACRTGNLSILTEIFKVANETTKDRDDTRVKIATSAEGYTPLMYAIINEDADIVQFILDDGGVDIHQRCQLRNNQSITALDLAREYRDTAPDVWQVLADKYPKVFVDKAAETSDSKSLASLESSFDRMSLSSGLSGRGPPRSPSVASSTISGITSVTNDMVMVNLDEIPVRTWKAGQVEMWLRDNGMADFVAAFHEQMVDGEMLLNDITEEVLKSEFGIKKWGQLKVIMKEIGKLRERAASQK